jgi:hypothetical protein
MKARLGYRDMTIGLEIIYYGQYHPYLMVVQAYGLNVLSTLLSSCADL